MAQAVCSSLQLAHTRTRTKLDVSRAEPLPCFARASAVSHSRVANRSAHSRDAGPRPSTRIGATPPEVPSEEAPAEGSSSATPLTKDTTVGPTAETSPLVRFAWYASEAFGKAVAVFRSGEKEGGEDGLVLDRPLGREEAAEMLRQGLRAVLLRHRSVAHASETMSPCCTSLGTPCCSPVL